MRLRRSLEKITWGCPPSASPRMTGTDCSTAISSRRCRSRSAAAGVAPQVFVFFKLTAYLLAPFYLAALLWRGRREPGYWRGFGERFGLGAPLPAPVWLHAASVGEVQAAAILVAALRQRDAQLPLLVTATTAAGLARARALFESAGSRRALRAAGSARRRAAIHAARAAAAGHRPGDRDLAESVCACAAAQVPLVLASARISARSARRYRWLGAALRTVLAAVAQVAAQTPADAQRFAGPGRAGRAHCRYWQSQGRSHRAGQRARQWPAAARTARARTGRSGWRAAPMSSRSSRCCRPIARCARHIRRRCWCWCRDTHGALPQSPSGCSANRSPSRGSRARSRVTDGTQVLLVDAMGLLLDFYAAGDVAFVGGSLVRVGGHNLLEPAALVAPCSPGPATPMRATFCRHCWRREGVRVVQRWRATGARGHGAAGGCRCAPAPGRAGAAGRRGGARVLRAGAGAAGGAA